MAAVIILSLVAKGSVFGCVGATGIPVCIGVGGGNLPKLDLLIVCRPGMEGLLNPRFPTPNVIANNGLMKPGSNLLIAVHERKGRHVVPTGSFSSPWVGESSEFSHYQLVLSSEFLVCIGYTKSFKLSRNFTLEDSSSNIQKQPTNAITLNILKSSMSFPSRNLQKWLFRQNPTLPPMAGQDGLYYQHITYIQGWMRGIEWDMHLVTIFVGQGSEKNATSRMFDWDEWMNKFLALADASLPKKLSSLFIDDTPQTLCRQSNHPLFKPFSNIQAHQQLWHGGDITAKARLLCNLEIKHAGKRS